MSADRPHARHAAAARKRKRKRSTAEGLRRSLRHLPPMDWPRFESGMSPVADLEPHEVAAVIAYVRDRQAEAWDGAP